MATWYHEFHTQGEGHEIAVDSTRNRPRFLLVHPIRINRFNVKTVEFPLNMSPDVSNTPLVFYTTYTFNTSSITFKDTLSFGIHERIHDGSILLSKIVEKWTYHATLAMAALKTAYGTHNYTETGTVPGTLKLSATAPTYTITPSGTYTGVPVYVINQTLAVAAGDALIGFKINFVPASILASLFDYGYYSSATAIGVASGGNITSLNTEPQMRTRPSYILLHSNLRSGAFQNSTSRPSRLTPDTIIAKIPVELNNTMTFGEVSQIWINPSQHPDLMYRATDRDYNELEYWFTYPDGLTMVNFDGKSFSLTIAMIVADGKMRTF